MCRLVLLTLLLGSSITFAGVDLSVGKPFPKLELPTASGAEELTSIEDFRGKKLMLHIFAAW